jgi:hypothetical protein
MSKSFKQEKTGKSGKGGKKGKKSAPPREERRSWWSYHPAFDR